MSGVKGIIGMHRFNFCLVVVLLWCENTISPRQHGVEGTWPLQPGMLWNHKFCNFTYIYKYYIIYSINIDSHQMDALIQGMFSCCIPISMVAVRQEQREKD